ncbi:hypothetical protein ASF48_17280 [Rathayibacter sp. Leaf299]|uniref:hypothetical protein n=1 Tax=Rathayibacter sp. Leaf299 TaxID=1736328 RepID=UPI0006F9B883|nr:hypothetical protein [Rathayibacter sp. Leaf299]KQQ18674.1 hypothetical protein ASF48_17280 [Rathayibacter sp. Leaf299]
MKTLARSVREPFTWVLVAVLAAGGIALLVVYTVDPPSHSIQPGYGSVLSYVITEVGVALGGWLASFAFLGTVMRAGAHKLGGTDRGRDRLDFIGKLFAVMAASLALWVAVLAIPGLSNTLGRFGLALLPLGGLFILLWATKPLLVPSRNATARRDERQQGGGQAP